MKEEFSPLAKALLRSLEEVLADAKSEIELPTETYDDEISDEYWERLKREEVLPS